MDPRITLLTLGVKDLAKSTHFYEVGLGWIKSGSSQKNVSFFQLNNIIFALYHNEALAKEVERGLGSIGAPNFALAHNVQSIEHVQLVLDEAKRAGGNILKSAQDTFWGGHSGYFSDLDGFVWEVAWNPKWILDEKGSVTLSK